MVKTKLSKKDMCDLQICMCTNSTNQDANLEEFYSPVCFADSLHIKVTLTTAFSLTLLLIDIINTYQSTLLVPDQMSYIHLLPFYIEWFKSRYPSISLPNSK